MVVRGNSMVGSQMNLFVDNSDTEDSFFWEATGLVVTICNCVIEITYCNFEFQRFPTGFSQF